ITVSASPSSGSAGPDAGPDTCSAGWLTMMLSQAKPGDIVPVGNCTIQGSFTVPPGVTLTGQGPGITTIAGIKAERALTLKPGGMQATKVSNMTITSAGTAGIVAVGSGMIEIDTVEVNPTTGIGIGVEGVTSLIVKTVKVTGPVTTINAGNINYP